MYRACRDWHGYLSAIAFLALIFFSLTGLILNHPEWTETLGARTHEAELTLPSGALRTAALSVEPGAALAGLLGTRTALLGRYASGEIYDGEAFLRFEGPRGSTDAVIALDTGVATVTKRSAPVAVVLNNLHRGKNAGAVWQAMIDIAGVLILGLSILGLSLIGYVLFFTLRFKLRTGLLLTATSAAVILSAFILFVP